MLDLLPKNYLTLFLIFETVSFSYRPICSKNLSFVSFFVEFLLSKFFKVFLEIAISRNYSLTLIDSLDTLVILGDFKSFQQNVDYLVNSVDFNQPFSVNVFEVTIRVLGSLLSAHSLITDRDKTFPNLYPNYDNGLLRKARVGKWCFPEALSETFEKSFSRNICKLFITKFAYF